MSDLAVHNDLHPTERRWFAVYTRARSEKWVQRALTKKGIHAYVPVQRLYRRYTRSTRLTEKPLIPGYVFVYINRPDYIPVLETEHVAGFVRFSKNLIAIPEPEIVLLRRITLEEDLDLRAVPGTIESGDPVEITAGNLTGLHGRVVKIEGKHRFQVDLEYLGCSLLITIDATFLQKINIPIRVQED